MKISPLKILMLKGLPGSGKSTWAKQFIAENPGWVRINKDSLREMMSGYRPGKDEEQILRWRNCLIGRALMDGKNVIVDDTNFHPKHELKLREIASACPNELQIDVEIKMFETPLEECIKNDLKRLHSVGERVIKKMWRQYLAPKYEKPTFDSQKSNVLLCDLDGTLAIHNGRSPYDAEKCDTDLVNPVVKAILDDQWRRGTNIIFVSGRERKFEAKTIEWLTKMGVPWCMLLMRPTDDNREDSVVKQELYERYIKNSYNVLFVLDDRNRVVDMWRRMGLTCLQVAEGDF